MVPGNKWPLVTVIEQGLTYQVADHAKGYEAQGKNNARNPATQECFSPHHLSISVCKGTLLWRNYVTSEVLGSLFSSKKVVNGILWVLCNHAFCQ